MLDTARLRDLGVYSLHRIYSGIRLFQGRKRESPDETFRAAVGARAAAGRRCGHVSVLVRDKDPSPVRFARWQGTKREIKSKHIIRDTGH